MASTPADQSLPSVHRLYVPVEGSRAGGRPLQMCYLRSRPIQLRGPDRPALPTAAENSTRTEKREKTSKSGPSFDFVTPRTEFLLAPPRLDAALLFPISIIGPPSGKRRLNQPPSQWQRSTELDASQNAGHEESIEDEDEPLWTAWDLHILRELVLQSLRSEEAPNPADQPWKRPRHMSTTHKASVPRSTPSVLMSLAHDICSLKFMDLIAFFVPDSHVPAQELSTFPWTSTQVLAICSECARINGGALPRDLADCVLCHVILLLLFQLTPPRTNPPGEPPLHAQEPSSASGTSRRGSSVPEETRTRDSWAEEAVLELVRLAVPSSSVLRIRYATSGTDKRYVATSLAPLDRPAFSIALSALEWEEAGALGLRADNEAAIAHWTLPP